MDDDLLRRVAAHEIMFRTHNEAIIAAIEHMSVNGEPHGFMCECATVDCHEMIELSLEQYREVRSDPVWFVVYPGHVVVAAESVACERDMYWIVAKFGVAGDAARSAANVPRMK